jgi:dipeptidyl aminopeptidase/acylaminoacyl peptidase
LDRSPQNGFRCARFPDGQVEVLGSEVTPLSREFEVEPVDDARFERTRAQFSYPPQPLNAKVESVDDALPYWSREVVSFDAPYSSERVQAHLFIPKSVEPPYRAVVFYPGATPFRLPSVDLMETTWFDFLVRTGFAVIHPIYEGHFGREGSRVMRERLTHWTMDIRRSIDYLETREDIAADKVAFYGHSYGAWNGPIFTAMEPRFKASVLFAGGALKRRWPAELQPLNHAPRATVPVLMVNGRDDFYYPEPAQRRLFDLLGAPEADKRYVPLEGGHFPGDWPGVMKEILDWLERYLGPAEPARGGDAGPVPSNGKYD